MKIFILAEQIGNDWHGFALAEDGTGLAGHISSSPLDGIARRWLSAHLPPRTGTMAEVDHCPKCGRFARVLSTRDNSTPDGFTYRVTTSCGQCGQQSRIEDGRLDCRRQEGYPHTS